MAYKFNVFTGNFDIVNDSVTPAGAQSAIEYFTLNATDISNGYITLSNSPNPPNNVALDIISGTTQSLNNDFSISGNQLTFEGTLATDLESGDEIRVIYTY